MKKNIVIVLLLIVSLGSLGFIVYDKFIKEEKVELVECNKEELCDECICDNDYEIEDEDSYYVEHSGVYTKDGKIYKLDVYKELIDNVKIQDLELNNKTLNLEKKDSILYVNDKKIDYADQIYITNNHIFVGHVAQCGLVFNSVIDSNLNVTDLDNNEKINGFQAYDIYLSEEGNLITVGKSACGDGPDVIPYEKVEFKISNGKLEITKEKLK